MRLPTTHGQENVSASLLERLERDKQEWDRWRKSRRKGERIPGRLWDIARSYVGELPLTRISREFRLDYNTLKRLSSDRQACRKSKQCRRSSTSPPGWQGMRGEESPWEELR